MVQLLWKTGWHFLKNIKIDLPYDPAIPLLGIHPKEMKAGCVEELFAHSHSEQHYSSQKVEAT